MLALTILLYSSTLESRIDLSIDSAYIRIKGSVPDGLTISHVSSSIHIFAPSIVSIFLGLPCSTQAFIILLTASRELRGNLVFILNVLGSFSTSFENDSPANASMLRTSAVVIAPSLTSFRGPYMNPPFSSSPNGAFLFTISLDTSTLPTFVYATFRPTSSATLKSTIEVLTGHTSAAQGCLCPSRFFIKRAPVTSPQ